MVRLRKDHLFLSSDCEANRSPIVSKQCEHSLFHKTVMLAGKWLGL